MSLAARFNEPDKTPEELGYALLAELRKLPFTYNNAMMTANHTNHIQRDAFFDLLKAVNLIHRGAKLDVCDKEDGITPLTLAALMGHHDIILPLINAGADINGTTTGNYTALIIAVDNGNLTTIKTLLNAGAKTGAKTNRGDTALIRAAFWGKAAAISLLVEAKADLTLTDNKGRDALDYAHKRGHTSAAAVIEKALEAQAEERQRLQRLKDSEIAVWNRTGTTETLKVTSLKLNPKKP